MGAGEVIINKSTTEQLGQNANYNGAYVYEVDVKGSKKVLSAAPASKEFLQDCRTVTEKYRKKD